MTRVLGPSRDQLDALGDEYAWLLADTLAVVAGLAAPRVDFGSAEELGRIRDIWAGEVDEALLPALGVGFEVGAASIRVALREAVGLTAAAFTDLAPTADALAEAYLVQARNRLVGVGDELWGHAREELLEGLRGGEGIGELAARVRKVAPDLTEPRAEQIARTEILGAVNAGALAQVLATGASGTKTWEAAHDQRVRPEHEHADEQTVPLREKFTIGGFPADRPHDPSLPPHLSVSCRCALSFDLDLDSGGPAGLPTGPPEGEAATVLHESNDSAGVRQRQDRSFLERVFAKGLAFMARLFRVQTAAATLPEREFEPEGGTVTADAARPVEHFHYHMAEGVSTGKRTFAAGAITWREPPFAFMWQKMVPETGGHGLAVQAGLITRAERSGEEIDFFGPLDLNSDDGLEYARRLVEGFARWGSVSPDENKVDVEVVWAEGTSEEDMLLGGEPEQYVFRSFNVAELTGLSVPALADATIEPTPALYEELAQRGALPKGVEVPQPEPVVTAGGNSRPPAEWFANPGLAEPSPIIVTDDGRVFGHTAPPLCHIGYGSECITPPHEDDFPFFATGEQPCIDGSRVAIGQITLGTGHAPLHFSAQRAAEHYDNTGTVVADVAVGNDEHGIWVAGAIRPGVSEERIHELRASGQVSGDWRRIGGQLRMVALLAVNVPGFPVAKTKVRVASGVPMAVVASGKVEPRPQPDLRPALERIAVSIGRDRPSRQRELAARVKAGRS